MTEAAEGFAGLGLLLGTYTPKLDEKGRLILPAKFRGQLSSGLVMTKGQERCLFFFNDTATTEIYTQIRQAPVTSKAARDYTRNFLAGASDEVPDKQGRVSIPTHLREYAGLDREVVVIGVGTRVEVWGVQAWATYQEQTEPDYIDQAEEIFPGLSF